ncbi:MAG: GtrA family protein [Clostridia bacterium]|nr:GtrA family protein [Clostridia bacterium]
MKKSSIIQMVKFTLFSISAGIIQIGSFTLMNELFPLPEWFSYLTSLLLSIVWNFTFNRRFTFKSAANVPIAMAKLLGFYAVFTPVSTYLVYLAEKAGVSEYITVILSMLSNFILEFLFSKFVIYKNQENTLTKKEK